MVPAGDVELAAWGWSEDTCIGQVGAVKSNFPSPILTHPSGLLDELGVPPGRALDCVSYRMR